jgi:mRNA interferase HigB
MRIISRARIRKYWEKHPETENTLKKWYKVVENASWSCFSDVRKTFRSTDWVRVNNKEICVFNIGGNTIRLIAAIHFNVQTVYIRAVLTHSEYDKQSWKKLI